MIMKRRFSLLLACTVIVAVTMAVLAPTHISIAAEKKLTLEELLSRKSIRIRDLHKLNMEVKPGHGPVLWAPLDEKREAWFWCAPGVASVLGAGKVLLVATVDANDENVGTILWPKEKVGHDYGKELETLYPRK
jgi:hypothetical protein